MLVGSCEPKWDAARVIGCPGLSSNTSCGAPMCTILWSFGRSLEAIARTSWDNFLIVDMRFRHDYNEKPDLEHLTLESNTFSEGAAFSED